MTKPRSHCTRPSDATREILDRCERGDYEDAATFGLRHYGDEILGYLVGVARDGSIADEAFSVFCEHLWRGLPGFRGDASFRTWAYTLARHALHRVRRDPSRGSARNVPLSCSPELDAMVESLRMTSLLHRQRRRDELTQLRRQLDVDDQTLIILRVDRGLSWSEIAKIMLDGEDAESESARVKLRKRFQRATTSLKQLVDRQGRAARRTAQRERS